MTKQTLLKKIGKNITKIREEKGFTRTELAQRCENTRQNLYRLETGNQNATIELYYRVAKGLGVPLKDLFDFEQ